MRIKILYNRFRSILHTVILSRTKGLLIGAGTTIFYKSNIICTPKSYAHLGGVKIGANCKIGRQEYGYHGGMPFFTTLLSDGEGSKITIGDNCRINGAYIHAEKSITIGNNCVMASGVNIIDSNGHEVRSMNRTVGRDTPKEVVIGNNVWICMNATILKGSAIGDNVVIAAGSVIQGTIPPNTIASTKGQLIITKIDFGRDIPR